MGKLSQSAFQESYVERNLAIAKAEIASGWAAVLVKDGQVIDREKGKGIKPALTLVRRRFSTAQSEERALEADEGLVFGDKVLGLAALKLGYLMGCRIMWGEMVSELAVIEGKRRGVHVEYGQLVPVILNAKGNGLCPMEHLAFSHDDDLEFYYDLSERIR